MAGADGGTMLDVTLSSWKVYERGTPVKVTGQRGSFTFYSVRLSPEGEPKWITVFGGTWQHSKYRHFHPSLVTPAKSKEKK